MKNKKINLKNYFPFTVCILGPCENQKVNFKYLKEAITFMNQLKISYVLVYNTSDSKKEYVLCTSENFST